MFAQDVPAAVIRNSSAGNDERDAIEPTRTIESRERVILKK